MPALKETPLPVLAAEVARRAVIYQGKAPAAHTLLLAAAWGLQDAHDLLNPRKAGPLQESGWPTAAAAADGSDDELPPIPWSELVGG